MTLPRTLPFLLLLATTVTDAAPLITCEPDRFVEISMITLFSALYITCAMVMAWTGFFTKAPSGHVRAVTLFISLAITTSLVEFCWHHPVRMTPRLNVGSFYTATEVREGLHLRDECIEISKDKESVTLLCYPDAGEVRLPLYYVESVQESLREADRQRAAVLHRMNTARICENQSGRFPGLNMSDAPERGLPLAAMAGILCAVLTVMLAAGMVRGVSRIARLCQRVKPGAETKK